MSNPARTELRGALGDALAYLREHYVKSINEMATMATKRRDRREPGAQRKEDSEAAFERVLRRHFARQAARAAAYLERRAGKLKAAPPLPSDLLDDDEFLPDLLRVLLEAARDGVAVFRELVEFELDYGVVNARALAWAQTYTLDLIRGLEATTREMLQSALEDFINTPGMTLGDLIERLPFTEARAEMIAITEVTRAYAAGTQLAGEELKKEFPDVRVVKQWFTNNDDLVCPICEPLNGQEVDIEAAFDGLDTPPAHPGCRCWMSTRTRIND